MATANFTGEEKQKTLEQLMCSTNLRQFMAGLQSQLTFISGFNIFLSITAFLGNALILTALRKESSLHSPSKLLLRSLAASDLCVGLIAEPVYAGYVMSVANEHWNICRFMFVVTFTMNTLLCGVSLVTLIAISVDRLLALLLGLRYKQVVTLKRTYVIVITFWVVSTVFSSTYFWNPLIIKWYSAIGASLCLVISISSYTKIFLTLRHRQNQLQDQAQQPNQSRNQLNIARYRKAVYSALWLQLTVIVCYLPNVLVVGLVIKSGLYPSLYLAWNYATTLLFLNSSLNPILYCWKIDEVRQAVKDTIRQVLCCFLS